LQGTLDLCCALGIKPDDWLPIGAVLLKLVLVHCLNCFPVECYKADYNAETSMPKMLLGKGLFLASSLMNNSCNANTYQVSYGNSIVFRAARPIAKGEEVTVCYRMPATDFSFEERQTTLLKEYKFKCRYERNKGLQSVVMNYL
jgi:SET domain